MPPATDRPMIVDKDTPPPLEGGGPVGEGDAVLGAEVVPELVDVMLMVTSTGD